MKWIQVASTESGNSYDSWDLVPDDADDDESWPSYALLDHYVRGDRWDYLLNPGRDIEKERWITISPEVAEWILSNPDEFYMEMVL